MRSSFRCCSCCSFELVDYIKEPATPLSQYFYAFFELFQTRDVNDNYHSMYENIYNTRLNYVQQIGSKLLQGSSPIFGKEGYAEIAAYINHLRNQPSPDVNELIDAISLMSTLEDECYHTQGSYFHVVLHNQSADRDLVSHLPIDLLLASAIENLCFAYTHVSKSDKYMNRVLDVYKLISIRLRQNKLNGIQENVYKIIFHDLPEQGALKTSSFANLTKRLNFTYQLEDTINKLISYIFQTNLGGGFKNLKTRKGHNAKKMIGGRYRNVYIDTSRRQYVKKDGKLVRVTSFQKTSKI